MSLNTLTDITIPRGPHNYDIRCYDLYVDGSIIGATGVGPDPSDFNYALSDPGNGKIDIYGLCKDYNGGVTGQTLLVLGEFNQHLHYSDALNNRIEITDDGSNGVNIIRSGASGTNHIPFKIIQNQNVLDMSDIELYLGKETSTAVAKLSIDNSSILIEDSSKSTTQKGLVEVSQLSVRQEVLNSTSVLSQSVLTSGEYKVILPSGTGTSGSCILNLDSTLALPKADITTYASPIGDASSLVLTPEEFSLSSNYSGVNRTISCDQGVYKITNLPPQSAPDVITVNPVSGLIGYGAGSAVTSLSLIGNPVHAFVNNTGALQYRGMISPANTINYNVTPTNIEMDVNVPNSTLINYQVPDVLLGSGNIIQKIGDTNQDSSLTFQTGGQVDLLIGGVGDLLIQTGGGDEIHDVAGRISLQSAIGDLRSLGLTSATTPNILYYNTGNGRITSGTAPSSGPIAVNYTPNTIPINSLTDTLLQAVTVPANTFTGILGQTIRINASGRINISAPGNAKIRTSINGVVVTSLARTGAVPIPSDNDYSITGYFTITSYSAPNAVFKYSIVTLFNNGDKNSIISTGTTSAIAINSSFDIETFGQTGATATITGDILKIWKE